MEKKIQKNFFQKAYDYLMKSIIKSFYRCVYCCFDMICCDEDCLDKIDCLNLESWNEDGICDCGFDEDDCC